MEATPHHEFSALYTSEPQLTRALAAEFRHDPQATERYFSSLLGVKLGELTDVGCEKDQRVDILLEFEHKTIAIEAKIDHEISEDQLERESEVADYLMLLLLDADDAAEHQDQVARVLTWAEILPRVPRRSRSTVRRRVPPRAESPGGAGAAQDAEEADDPRRVVPRSQSRGFSDAGNHYRIPRAP